VAGQHVQGQEVGELGLAPLTGIRRRAHSGVQHPNPARPDCRPSAALSYDARGRRALQRGAPPHGTRTSHTTPDTTRVKQRRGCRRQLPQAPTTG